MNLEALRRTFYTPSAAAVAPRLLGHWLMRRTADGLCGGVIVETEAYLRDDPACHGAVGQTRRNRVMFGEPGHAYVYFIYGCHFCVNAVCGPPGVAEAVLIRAVDPRFGEEIMRRQRPVNDPRALSNGPGKLCSAMNIGRALDGADLCDAGSELFIARNPGAARFRREHGAVIVTTRIGISVAGELPLRFYLQDNHAVSRRPRKAVCG